MLVNAIGWLALTMSGASFVLFVVLSLRRSPPAMAHQGGTATVELQAGLSDVAKLAEALGKLAEGFAKWTEALAKAGPAISSLVASLVFLGFSVLCATLQR